MLAPFTRFLTATRSGVSSRFSRRAILVVGMAVMVGCSSAPPAGDGLNARDTRGLEASERTVKVTPASSGARPPSSGPAPAAVIAGQTLTMAQLGPALAEAAGAQVLEEILITHTAERELALAGMALTQTDLDNERAELAGALASGDVNADPELLIDSVRRSRGLGEERFGLLVRRTAALRKLVAPQVSVTEEEIAIAHRVRYGARYRVRMLMTATEREAAMVVAELGVLDEPARRARFIQLAMERSIDASSRAGGLLEPISPSDPAYPAIVRNTIPTLTPGQIGPVMALNPNYAVVMFEEVIPEQGVPIESVASTLREELRRRQERLLMDRRAQGILDSTPITVLDPSLQWAWRNRTARRKD